MYDRLGTYVYGPYATIVLGFLFFIEAIFFVPVDPLLILYCIANKNRSFFYATVATITSVIGGLVAYGIGFALWESIGQMLVKSLFSLEQFNHALEQFKHYQTWAVLIAGFTPLPYKLVTLSAGFCNLPLMPFVLCSFIARGARFFLVAGIISIWGHQVKEFIDRYFNLLVILFTILIILAVWLIL